jgi:hypothetical protein
VINNGNQVIYLKSSVLPVTGTATTAPVLLKWYKDSVEITFTTNVLAANPASQTPGATNQCIAVSQAGKYSVKAFYGTSQCAGVMSAQKHITGASTLVLDGNEPLEDASSKLNEELVWDAAVSRNPYDQFVNIRLNSESESNVELTMIDAMGKVVSQDLATIKELGSLRIGEGLMPGMYLINIRQDDNIKTIRVIKQ